MANLINGNTYASYGLVLRRFNNLLNMPDRLGKYFYSWGSEIQPLVLEENIFWKHNDIKIDVLWDSRLGVSLEASLIALRKMQAVTLETDDYGTFTG